MKDYIVDASVVSKWLLPESDSDRARRLIAADCGLRAPDLIMSEFASVMLKRVQRREISVEECSELLQRFVNDYLDVRVRTVQSRLVAENALRIAFQEKQSIYDCLYLALAVQAKCQLITADERLVNGITSVDLRKHVVALKDPKLKL